MSNVTGSDVAISAVCAALQKAYGDATQTALDRQAARDVIAALRALGWASLDEVALLIEAAGGSITVPDRLMLDGRKRRVSGMDDFAAGGKRYVVTVEPS